MSLPFSYCIVKRTPLAFRAHDAGIVEKQFTDLLSMATLYDSPEDAFRVLWTLHDPNNELAVIEVGITYEEVEASFNTVIPD